MFPQHGRRILNVPPFFSQFLNCKRKCYQFFFLRSQSLDRVHLVFPIFFRISRKMSRYVCRDVSPRLGLEHHIFAFLFFFPIHRERPHFPGFLSLVQLHPLVTTFFDFSVMSPQLSDKESFFFFFNNSPKKVKGDFASL